MFFISTIRNFYNKKSQSSRICVLLRHLNNRFDAYSFFTPQKISLLVFSLVISVQAAYALSQDEMIRRQQERVIQQEQRQQRLQQQNLPQRTQKPISIQSSPATTDGGFILNEQPCWAIKEIQLVDENGKNAKKFQFALRYAKKKSGFKNGMCLGQNSISHLIALTQNKIIDKGYTTTQVGLMPQNIHSGSLNITVIAGKMGDIRYQNCDDKDTYGKHCAIGIFNNKLPLTTGEIFNLRDLETGLENLQRVPTANADIQITPSQMVNASDIVVDYQQSIPLRLSLNIDDSGSRSTGKYQAGGAISLDNPLGLSDLFYLSYNQSIGGKKDKYTDNNGKTWDSRTADYALHYSFPIYSWTLGINHSAYRYHQAVAGAFEHYDYNGKNRTLDFYLSKNLYRDGQRKTDATVKLWRKESKNFIDDAEVEVQRKELAGWAAEISHREYIKDAVLSLHLAYKRGTGLLGAKRVPEEAFKDGTSRMKLWTLDATFSLPFVIKRQPFSIDSRLFGQYNQTPLLTSDKISIGSRHTVRGFDGETTLTAEKGFYWQNNLNYAYRPNHQVYLGYDYGRVSGKSKADLLGQSLSGVAMGLKGSLSTFGTRGKLNYDLFVARPIVKPHHYPTHKTAYGFALNAVF